MNPKNIFLTIPVGAGVVWNWVGTLASPFVGGAFMVTRRPLPASIAGEIMTNYNDYNRQLIEEFRADRSKFAGPGSRPLLLLTTIGAKSGQRYTTPMMYIPHGDRLIVIASNIGAPKHPDWYHNLVANPEVTVEIGTETYDTSANVIQGAERQQLWTWIVEQYPFFAEHQAKTTRQIPLIDLSRSES